ncbi:DEAD/DEAH box ATP-dependent RNA helicase, putative [Plasmodium berghei]|uniref:ATP-dependent RNA helicase DRS1, putative n=2 Tax=Plasmodium berghei TaxID=5821 RepID=A0A509AWA3_PLABA|nr:ATP-dependent RNA helicase DRS1, putative [Plasmodium berghei ANKA]CXJ29916.1 DEAD/DEAH box ATP-dependent RNA helicase, putative [Plasmodium berghei]SCM27099.1 DEAD/DEAH box ATP-dependent RNA helicase, putative [Plasmodium berghei]SCN28825.1 DEAD/DEAH box ATP-dependent RNA helicase, putative [Plasmodium berghei]SCO63132.1 DEAD/DEAH box ATP-dependent RNA helicase, putative [Plasmodium berghei]SCO64572.1 DEAD/DEAH box ATP-dependent RNA helicase, putative [Plasmodium berghei]|eukprot:XP_034424471.1 ATP-dependent RNA helicase DRS1, putative [Plasmodium berghei ANKA]
MQNEIEKENKECSNLNENIKCINNEERSEEMERKDDEKENLLIEKNTLWSDLHISRPLLKVLYELKFENPTYIQKDVIPLALEGKSILANSETGSGKTLAFVLPMLERLLYSPNIKLRKENRKSICITKALILLPTRELAMQCYEVINNLTKYSPITCSLFCGGIDPKEQENEYKKKKDIFVCTPGRILDLLLNSSNDFINFLEIVIFDEADKLLELGFKEECLKILDVCKFKKQILFFSATLTKDIKELANFSLRNPIFIQSENKNKDGKSKGDINTQMNKNLKSFKISENLHQEFLNIINEKYRKATLLHLCNEVYKKNCIIFFKTRKETHLMYILLKLLNFKCEELHGLLTQKKRIESILKFKNQEVDFLLCTELASRGIDIDHIKYVINYSLPANVVKYVHRIGRTARIGKQGTSCTFFLPKEKENVKKIIKGVKKNNNSKIYKRVISEEKILYWDNIIKKNNKKMKEILENENVEKEIEKSNISINKIKNLITFKDEIYNRPRKTWFISNKEKSKLRKMNFKNGVMKSEAHLDKDGNKAKESIKENESDNNNRGKKHNNDNIKKKNRNKRKLDDQEVEEEDVKKKLKSYRSIIRDLKLNILPNKKDKNNKLKWNKKNEDENDHKGDFKIHKNFNKNRRNMNKRRK